MSIICEGHANDASSTGEMSTEDESVSAVASGPTRLQNISDSEVCHTGCKSPGIVRYGGGVVHAENTASRKGP
ncbi:hypothetical protein Y032_0055g2591 [Ancylostoma ceylanicum]|uniref:Uncharacterized protein n=1 Tax=Ancylostoma ceylanicum TaxID=53326 RepID=A0A016U5C8_9BILA|nr:hypothetical protein Y032_0055g2591 [Ancylostoma ceylanicum]